MRGEPTIAIHARRLPVSTSYVCAGLPTAVIEAGYSGLTAEDVESEIRYLSANSRLQPCTGFCSKRGSAGLLLCLDHGSFFSPD